METFLNRIRTIETFSGTLKGQIISINAVDGTYTTNLSAATTGTQGLSSLAGDGRATPGAYQVDIVNSNDIFWQSNATSGMPWNSFKDISFLLNSNALEFYCGIKVDSEGKIISIGRDAAAYLANNPSFSSLTWSDSNNPFVGGYIADYQDGLKRLYLAGTNPSQPYVGMSLDTRVMPDSMMKMSEKLQNDVSTTYTLKNYYKTIGQYDEFKNIFNPVNGKSPVIDIQFSNPAWGLEVGKIYQVQLNPEFFAGGGYVAGYYTRFVNTLAEARANPGVIFNTNDYIKAAVKYNDVTNSYTVVDSSLNVDKTYPTFYQYGTFTSSSSFPALHGNMLESVQSDPNISAFVKQNWNKTVPLGYIPNQSIQESKVPSASTSDLTIQYKDFNSLQATGWSNSNYSPSTTLSFENITESELKDKIYISYWSDSGPASLKLYQDGVFDTSLLKTMSQRQFNIVMDGNASPTDGYYYSVNNVTSGVINKEEDFLKIIKAGNRPEVSVSAASVSGDVTQVNIDKSIITDQVGAQSYIFQAGSPSSVAIMQLNPNGADKIDIDGKLGSIDVQSFYDKSDLSPDANFRSSYAPYHYSATVNYYDINGHSKSIILSYNSQVKIDNYKSLLEANISTSNQSKTPATPESTPEPTTPVTPTPVIPATPEPVIPATPEPTTPVTPTPVIPATPPTTSDASLHPVVPNATSHVGIVVGSVVGLVLLITFIAVVYYFYKKSKAQAPQGPGPQGQDNSAQAPGPQGQAQAQAPVQGQDNSAQGPGPQGQVPAQDGQGQDGHGQVQAQAPQGQAQAQAPQEPAPGPQGQDNSVQAKDAETLPKSSTNAKSSTKATAQLAQLNKTNERSKIKKDKKTKSRDNHSAKNEESNVGNDYEKEQSSINVPELNDSCCIDQVKINFYGNEQSNQENSLRAEGKLSEAEAIYSNKKHKRKQNLHGEVASKR